ncbi:hypothetical protein ACIP4X_23200 [Streptomyces sp. NPDC088817]|uniref:hypothetical protein n=1 Tax=unclassified Streptomyces TaxID=2593676 RepID=UPI0036E49138
MARPDLAWYAPPPRPAVIACQAAERAGRRVGGPACCGSRYKDLIEIDTAPASHRGMQELNRTDPAAVDKNLAPLLPQLRRAVSVHCLM